MAIVASRQSTINPATPATMNTHRGTPSSSSSADCGELAGSMLSNLAPQHTIMDCDNVLSFSKLSNTSCSTFCGTSESERIVQN